MNQGIPLTKLEQEMQYLQSQQEIIMQKLLNIESWFQASSQQLPQQQLAWASTRHNLPIESSSPNPHQYLQTDSTHAPPHHQQFFSSVTAASQQSPLPPQFILQLQQLPHRFNSQRRSTAMARCCHQVPSRKPCLLLLMSLLKQAADSARAWKTIDIRDYVNGTGTFH